MIITPHMLVGAAIGACSPKYWIAFCLGIIVHFILDTLPHWEYLDTINIKKRSHLMKMGFDFILGSSLVICLALPSPQRIIIIFTALISLIPDCLAVACQSFNIKWLRPFFHFHHTIHNSKRYTFWQALPVLIVISVISIMVLVDKWV